jgi:hypothetical protein
MEDLLFDDGAMKIINSVTERKLREGKAETYPISGYVRYIVEEDSADRQIAQFLEGGGMGDSVQDRAGTCGLKGEWYESGEAAGLVLKFAQTSQMIDSVRGSLDVAV